MGVGMAWEVAEMVWEVVGMAWEGVDSRLRGNDVGERWVDGGGRWVIDMYIISNGGVNDGYSSHFLGTADGGEPP